MFNTAEIIMDTFVSQVREGYSGMNDCYNYNTYVFTLVRTVTYHLSPIP
jgi:hypothetical protein